MGQFRGCRLPAARHRWSWAWAAALPAGLALATAWAAPGGAETDRSVIGRASAAGARTGYSVTDFLVVSQFLDGGGPLASAETDITGRSVGEASLPYPGEAAIAGPGVLSVVLGQSVPLAYPFHVRADNPAVSEAKAGDPTGAYQVRATAGPTASSATAALVGRNSISGSRADSRVDLNDDCASLAEAESADTGISIGEGTLRIASVVSRATSKLEPGASAPSVSSELVIEGASVAGQPVTIDGKGVHFAETSLPTPPGAAPGSAEEILARAGITVEMFQTVDGRDGRANSDLLFVTQKHAVPASSTSEGTLAWRFGGASAQILVPTGDEPAAKPGPAPGGPGRLEFPGQPNGPAPDRAGLPGSTTGPTVPERGHVPTGEVSSFPGQGLAGAGANGPLPAGGGSDEPGAEVTGRSAGPGGVRAALTRRSGATNEPLGGLNDSYLVLAAGSVVLAAVTRIGRKKGRA